LTLQQPLPTVPLARWYAWTGDNIGALAMLERLVAERPAGLQQLKADPAFDLLRSDPRFEQLLRRAAVRNPERFVTR
jgi:hypothetical protein